MDTYLDSTSNDIISSILNALIYLFIFGGAVTTIFLLLSKNTILYLFLQVFIFEN